jgi:threonine synthase
MYHNDLSTKRTFLLILTDKETTEAMKTIYKVNYIVELHGAVGYLGLKRITKFNALEFSWKHPIKFF